MDMRYALFRLVCLCLFSFFLLEGCSRGKVPFNEPSDLRGKSMEELQQMQKQILQEKAGKILSDEELACIEMIREQERRLENPWIFGEWRERHTGQGLPAQRPGGGEIFPRRRVPELRPYALCRRLRRLDRLRHQ